MIMKTKEDNFDISWYRHSSFTTIIYQKKTQKYICNNNLFQAKNGLHYRTVYLRWISKISLMFSYRMLWGLQYDAFQNQFHILQNLST
ncbi:hypothetical protein FKM82_027997 [Ascaphus truei]